VDVCELAGLQLAAGTPRSLFDDDRWILTGLAKRHRSIQDWELEWDFTEIISPAWRVMTKEIVLALLAPRFEPVLQCPLAVRAVRSPRTANRARIQLTAWFNWLSGRGISTPEEVTQELCEQYLEERSWSVPEPDKPQRRLDPATLQEIVRTMKLVPLYGELLSTDGHRSGFIPWPGKTIEEAKGEHHVQLTVQAFRDFQAGRLPAGPGARRLVEVFAHMDAELKEAARSDPKVLRDDAHLESLLRKQAETLHVGPANFCWFRDPAKALCLRLSPGPLTQRSRWWACATRPGARGPRTTPATGRCGRGKPSRSPYSSRARGFRLGSGSG
jgi:hypothetical protein